MVLPRHYRSRLQTVKQNNKRNTKRFPKINRARQNAYSRNTDCWNCGSQGHRKEFCPMPSSLKCSFCRRKDVRSDQCPCRRQAGKKTSKSLQVPDRIQEKIETAIFVNIYGKTVRALLNPRVQETTICEAVAELVRSESGNLTKKLILRGQGTIKMVYYMKFKVSTRPNNGTHVDGIINPHLAENIIILGMQALQKLGFKFFVGGQEVKTRVQKFSEVKISKTKTPKIRSAVYVNSKVSKDEARSTTYYNNNEGTDDDGMSFLDPEEAHRIEEWNW